MTFFLDANLPYSAKDIVAQYGAVSHARDAGLLTAGDDEIIAHAIANEAILITKDLDFGNPHLYPREKHHGLVILRVPFYFTAAQICRVLEEFLSAADLRTLAKNVTVVEPGRSRVGGA